MDKIYNKSYKNYEFVKDGVFIAKLYPDRINDERKGVYILYNSINECIYVGQGTVKRRLTSHTKNDKSGWKYANVIYIENKAHRLFTEKLMIRYLNPILNKSRPDFITPYCIENEKIKIELEVFQRTYLKVNELQEQMKNIIELEYDSI